MIRRQILFMENVSIYERFVPGLYPDKENKADKLWFVFKDKKILMEVREEQAFIPGSRQWEELSINAERLVYLGEFDGRPCYAVQAKEGETAPQSMEFRDLRSLFEALGFELFLLAGRAFHVLYWYGTHRFCGSCGAENEDKVDERAKICPKCGAIAYPRISPAIIVAVTKGNEILLARAKHFAQNFYSVIAGFVEIGETFEDCVKREVMEEVGIRIKNLKYFGSQPWPFPDSVMVAFTAEYESGEIRVDGHEIEDAGWYGKDNMPQVPTNMSIAGRMISWYKTRC